MASTKDASKRTTASSTKSKATDALSLSTGQRDTMHFHLRCITYSSAYSERQIKIKTSSLLSSAARMAISHQEMTFLILQTLNSWSMSLLKAETNSLQNIFPICAWKSSTPRNLSSPSLREKSSDLPLRN